MQEAGPDSIRDHESRVCHALPERVLITDTRSSSASRKVDFHDLELFFEFGHLTTAQIVVQLATRMDEQLQTVDVDEIIPGDEMLIEVSSEEAKERILFVRMKREKQEELLVKLT